MTGLTIHGIPAPARLPKVPAQRHPSSLNIPEIVLLGRGAESIESELRRVTEERNTARSERDAALERSDLLEEQHESVVEGLRLELALLRRQLSTSDQDRISASFERLSLTVTGKSYAVVAERLTASVRADSARLVDWMSDLDARRRISPPMPVFDLSDSDAVVVDVP